MAYGRLSGVLIKNRCLVISFLSKKGRIKNAIRLLVTPGAMQIEKGIKTIAEFFNYSFAKTLKEEQNIKADLILSAFGIGTKVSSTTMVAQ